MTGVRPDKSDSKQQGLSDLANRLLDGIIPLGGDGTGDTMLPHFVNKGRALHP